MDLDKVRTLLEDSDVNDMNLITLLQTVQEAYGFLPEVVLEEISKATGIREAKLYGVATFYSQFRLKPIGKNLISLCQGTACFVNGSSKIETQIKEILAIEEGEITDDGLFTYVNVACLGCCSLAPVMMINGQTYGNLNKEKLLTVIEDIRSGVKKA